MNPLQTYVNLGTRTLNEQKKIETVRLFNVLALLGIIIHLAFIILLQTIDQEEISLINLTFLIWYTLIPYLNSRNHYKWAVFLGNLSFAPMAILLALSYGGKFHVEHFLFIALAITFFSYTQKSYLFLFAGINSLSYAGIVIYRLKGWFPPVDPSLFQYEWLLVLTDTILVLLLISVVLFAVNRLYQRMEKELKSNAKELKRKTITVEQLLEDARKSNTTKLKLLKVISHDLRAPFTGLLGLTELMEQQYERYSKDEMKEMLRMLSDSSKNTLMLIENLVQWSKLQSNEMKPDRKNLRLNSIIKQNISIYSNMAMQKNITLINEIDDFLMVNADENMLMMIVRNLINNAIKFTTESGTIKLTAVQKRRYIRITVADSGIGMTAEQINAVLVSEEQTSKSGTSGEKGSGLGLLLCKEFVEKHNCRMYIDSQPGGGTTITFTMPIAKPDTEISL
ncbi:MAG: HAMP domain-containing sensor histidine kinase [Paludibacter sp.]|jgi:signal transduction histidine kinase|nr:HAMP domain-containing sensor histidine kinase [Paludibacter sp.]